MNDQALLQALDRVGLRYRRLVSWTTWALCWLMLALLGLAMWAWVRGAGLAAPGAALVLLIVLPALLAPALATWRRRVHDPRWVARRIEQRFPDLDTRLLAALEQHGQGNAGLGYLQQVVIDQAVEHGLRRRWEDVVPSRRLHAARLAQWSAFLLFGTVVALLAADLRNRPAGHRGWPAETAETIRVEPEDASLERGAALLVLARFGGAHVPGEATLLLRDAEGAVRPMPMSRSLDDPLFAARVPGVKQDLSYAVRYGEKTTRWYKVSVFDYPELRQADAELRFPEYTGLAPKNVEDTRSLTAVEGTRATLVFRLNKPVAEAKLAPVRRGGAPTAAPAEAVELKADPADPSVYRVTMELRQSQAYRLQLMDADRRANRDPAELVLNVTSNRPPDLKLEWPGHDVDVSPLEEMAVRARVWDDFGVQRVGLSYSLAGQPSREVVLAEAVPGKERRAVAHLISLEQLSAQPDQLLSYHLWVEDLGPDGKVRRTSGDMFFAEVRPFEEIYRQGQQPAGGEQEQQQQQQQGGGQDAQQAEQLAELQKQIIAATWKVLRRETAATPSAQLAPDVKLIQDSQASAREQASSLGERLTDERSRGFLQSALKQMEAAASQLSQSAAGPTVEPLAGALAAEQAAYQDLLKLRAREHEVVRGNQQQGQQSASSAASRRQRQLNQLDLANQENRYETQRSAAPQQPQEAEQRETRQVLSRLRELAQRQEDLNRQIKELQSALETARDEQQREEIQRQLARLRDQQRQQLRDTDELRDRMDQPGNQERMADARQQLDQTRSDLRRASEDLDRGQTAEAAADGQRASEQLGNLQEQFRRSAAGQFNDTMTRMRQDARELDQNQQSLSQRLAELDQGSQRQPGLRDPNDRQEVARQFQQQKQQLDTLLNTMRQTVQEAENTEPLLSKQLYDTIRQATQQQPDKALEVSRQLMEHGFNQEARQSEAEAGKGIAQIRQGVEQAAKGVLGDETEALRRARNELDALTQQLEREMSRVDAAATQPGVARGGGRLTTQPGAPPASERQLAENRAARQAAASQPAARDGNAAAQTQPAADGRTADARPQGAAPPRDAQERQAQAGQTGRQEGRRPGSSESPDSASDDRQAGAPPRDRQAAGETPGRQQADAQSAQGPQPAQTQRSDQQAGGQSRQGTPRGNPQPRGAAPGKATPAENGEPQQAETAPDAASPDAADPRQANARRPGQNQPSAQEPRNGGAARADNRNPPADRSPGQTPSDQNAQNDAARNPGSQQAAAGRSNDFRLPGGPDPERDVRRLLDQDPANAQQASPITGAGFREWSDRLRDVEEMVGDPRLRAEAARIRERAGAFRAEFKRHSEAPNWDLVRQSIGRPLYELRNAVSQELLRRESTQALVPLDRDPVPPAYAEQVRRYYERLGSGK